MKKIDTKNNQANVLTKDGYISVHASNFIKKNVKNQICFDLNKQNVSKTYRMHKKKEKRI